MEQEELMHGLRWIAVGVLLGLGVSGSGRLAGGAEAQSDPAVLQHHKDASRDGHYVDPALTRAAAARMRRDVTINAVVAGRTYAQPLFWAAAGPGEKDLLFVATEQNQVSALDASSGAVVWQRTVGPPVPRSSLPCGNVDPLGITGTPVIDARSRTLFLAAMTTADGGGTKKHQIFALSIDDGTPRPGWPVDASAGARAGSVRFDSAVQHQRGALILLGDTLYVPYGGHFGDCGRYRGWVVGVPIANPAAPTAWATRAIGGGVWAPGGIASDGASLYVATGNTFGVTTWSDGEAVIRLAPDLQFSQKPTDFFTPTDWESLDLADADLGGSGPLLFRAPGATPSELIIALGKDGKAYLIDRANMGGVSAALARLEVSRGPIINAAAAYTTTRGTYVVFNGRGSGCPDGRTGDLTAIRVGATLPPTLAVAWCATQQGRGSPIVTTTDGKSDAIVWSVGAERDNRLRAFDGDTGAVIFDGGGPDDAMTRVERFQTPIAARGRIFVAGDDRLYAFTAR
jgi:hypothetical protein